MSGKHESLVKQWVGNPCIDTDYFPNTPASVFWSSSPNANNSYAARIVSFDNGHDSNYLYGFKFNAEFVRLVRGGK